MVAMWTAFDLSTLQTNVEAGLVLGVGITLAFLGYRLIKKTAGRF